MRVIYDGVDESQLPSLLTELARSKEETEGTEYLFASRALYEEFQARISPGWFFQELGPVDGDTLRLTIDGHAVITGMTW